MGYSGTTYGGADMTTIIIVMIVIIAVAVLIWLAVQLFPSIFVAIFTESL